MAYYDHEAAKRRQDSIDKFNELRKHITSTDDNGNVNEWILADKYISELEHDLKKQKEKLEQYQDFFILMSKLMPKQYSIHDKLI